MLILMLISLLPWLLLGGGVLFLGLRAVRAFERRETASVEMAALRARLEALEGAFAAQEEEMQRLADGQHFTQRLLMERSPTPGSATASEPGR